MLLLHLLKTQQITWSHLNARSDMTSLIKRDFRSTTAAPSEDEDRFLWAVHITRPLYSATNSYLERSSIIPSCPCRSCASSDSCRPRGWLGSHLTVRGRRCRRRRPCGQRLATQRGWRLEHYRSAARRLPLVGFWRQLTGARGKVVAMCFGRRLIVRCSHLWRSVASPWQRCQSLNIPIHTKQSKVWFVAKTAISSFHV